MSSPSVKSAPKSRSGNLELRFVLITFIITTTIVVMSCVGIYFMHKRGVLRVAEKEFYSKTFSINITLQHLFKHSRDHQEHFQPIVKPFLDEILQANHEKLKALFIHDSNQQVLLATSGVLPIALNEINFKKFQENPTTIVDKKIMIVTIPMKIQGSNYLLSAMYALDVHFAAVKTNLIIPLTYIGITYILILVILAFVVAKKMIQPLRRLTKAIKQSFPNTATQGSIGVTKLNEFGELEALFKNLLAHLEKHHAEERQLQLNLMQTDKLVTIGTLAAGVAHEVNNPITGMQSCMAHLKKTCSDNEKALRYIDPVDQSILHIKNAVQGLLDYTRVRNYSFTSISIEKILDQVLRVVQPQIDKKRVTIIRHFPSETCTGSWDFNALNQVFMNLILNALHVLESKDDAITITGTREKNVLILRFSDTGPGIPAEILPKIFNPFFTTKAQGKGTGLGLAVCKSIIEAHNGTISAQSYPGEGTTFLITLPLQREDHA